MRGLEQAFPLNAKDEALRRALRGDVGSQDATPIFVVGLPRSGSTLIEQILASHPGVYGAGGAIPHALMNKGPSSSMTIAVLSCSMIMASHGIS